MSQKRDSDLIMVLLIVTGLFVLNTVSLKYGHTWGDDFSQYIVQAKSLVEGTVPEMLDVSKFRYENSENKLIGPVLYPWGFPLLLSGVYYFFGLDILVMKVFTGMFFLLSLIVIYLLFKERMGRVQILLLILILGINPVFFEAREDVLSDFPFLFFSLLALLMIQRFLIDEKPYKNNVLASNVLIGACLFITCAIRTNGLVLLPTLLIVQIVEGIRSYRDFRFKPSRAVYALVPYAVFFVLTGLLQSSLPSESSYTDQLEGLGIMSVMRNLSLYIRLPVDFFTMSMGANLKIIGKILFVISLPCVCIGLFKSARDHYLFLVFAGLTMALFILWPGVQGLRYIFPVMPFYLFFLFAGLSALWPADGRQSALDLATLFSTAAAVIFGVTVLGQAAENIRHPHEIMEGPYTRESKELFNYISHNTRDTDIVVFYKPRAMWLFSGRKSMRLSRPEDIMLSKARYIACRKNDNVDLALKKKMGIARRVFSNNTYKLYARMQVIRELSMDTEASPSIRKVAEAPPKKKPAREMKKPKKKKARKEPRRNRHRHVIEIYL